VFWFWFWWVHHGLMVVVDVAWWLLAIGLTKGRLWRVVISVFLAVQLTCVASGMAGFDWPSHVPRAAYMMVLVWHYLGLALLLPVGAICGYAWIRRCLVRVRAARQEPPVAAPVSANSLTRREFLGAAASLAPPLFTIGLTSVALARLDNLRVRRFSLAIPTLPRALDGMTLVHLTDLHIGRLSCARVLREMADKTNSLRPDLVLWTGDLIDYALSDLSDGIALVKAVEGRYGAWLAEGNHDLADDEGQFQRRVKAAGLPLLLDESALTKVRGYPVQIFGLRWISGADPHRDHVTALQLRQVLRQCQPDAFPILLSHHPHAFDAAVNAGLPLTLAGHTHGGQVMLDPKHGLGSVMFRYWSGLYRRGRSQLVVSNGVGTWLPFRINAPAEIVHITLRCAETRG
jgi:predicted MPP superfamily phosphohydrolase